jgi:magnesium transporter
LSLVKALADELVIHHPEQAVATLERLGADSVAALLSDSSRARGATLLRRLSPTTARAVIELLSASVLGPMFDQIPIPTTAILLRGVDADVRDGVLDEMQAERARGVRALLRHPPGTAASYMDPLALSLPQDLTADEALERVRDHAESSSYNLYVVDRDQRLTGVPNLRELLLAPPRSPLSDVMRRDPRRIRADSDRSGVLDHPGWREVHSLPVVDDEGHYLGAIRYRTLRRLEEERRASLQADEDAPAALGSLFATGLGGLLEAITGPGDLEPHGGRDGGQ